MHEPHPAFRAPTNDDIPIWRYIDLTKFVSMLEYESLHFARADIMSDPFEGSTTQPSLDIEREALEIDPESWVGLREQYASFNRRFRKYIYLSCWHMSEYESAAMWSIYQSQQARGLAIRSTHRRLADSLVDPRTVYIGELQYIDYTRDPLPINNQFHLFTHKRRSFEFERELRAVHGVPHLVSSTTKENTSEWAPVGDGTVPIATNLDRLVEAIYVAPGAPKWFRELIVKVLATYGRDWPVIHSDLDSKPLF